MDNLIALKLHNTSEETQSLGPMLGKLAKKLKVKQTDLAKKSNISRISVNRFFRGKSEVRASDLVTLLRHLGIHLDEQIQKRILE